jgi:thymidylate synthase
MNPEKRDLFSFVYDDFELTDYEAQPHIAAPIAV